MEDLECERTLTHNTHTHGRKRTVLYGSHDSVENYCKCNSVWRTRKNKSVLKYQQYHLVAQIHTPERFHSPFLAGGMNFPPSSWIPDNFQVTPASPSEHMHIIML